jgi:uncharacterized ferritin-like protein (DUF455 family)
LAIVHAVHESRGLDQSPRMIAQLISYGDKESATMLEAIERVTFALLLCSFCIVLMTSCFVCPQDEITHVGSGVRWFRYIIERQNANRKTKVFVLRSTTVALLMCLFVCSGRDCLKRSLRIS